MSENKQYLWVEKYRPQRIDDCILPQDIKSTFAEMVSANESQNLLLSGGPGCGKTTIARALCNELDADHIVVNCSEDGNIDTLRTKIRNFASTVSLSGGKKIVILDEFDYSNADLFSHVTSRIESSNPFILDVLVLNSRFKARTSLRLHQGLWNDVR